MFTRSSNLFKKSIEVDHLKFLFESIPKNQKSVAEYSEISKLSFVVSATCNCDKALV